MNKISGEKLVHLLIYYTNLNKDETIHNILEVIQEELNRRNVPSVLLYFYRLLYS